MIASLRPIRVDDQLALRRFWAELSPESRHRRFLSAKPELSPDDLRYLTEIDFAGHVAFVATPPERPGEIVGVGRFVRLAEDPESAEFAIAVADAWQRRGIGRALALRLVDEARARGIRRFQATILPENRAVRRLFETLTARLERRREGGVEEVRIPLAA